MVRATGPPFSSRVALLTAAFAIIRKRFIFALIAENVCLYVPSMRFHWILKNMWLGIRNAVFSVTRASAHVPMMLHPASAG